jgi:hypothetical protein
LYIFQYKQIKLWDKKKLFALDAKHKLIIELAITQGTAYVMFLEVRKRSITVKKKNVKKNKRTDKKLRKNQKIKKGKNQPRKLKNKAKIIKN